MIPVKTFYNSVQLFDVNKYKKYKWNTNNEIVYCLLESLNNQEYEI